MCVVVVLQGDVPCLQWSQASEDKSSNKKSYGKEAKDNGQQKFWARSTSHLSHLLLLVQPEQVIGVNEAERDIGANSEEGAGGASDPENVVVEDVIALLERSQLDFLSSLCSSFLWPVRLLSMLKMAGSTVFM